MPFDQPNLDAIDWYKIFKVIQGVSPFILLSEIIYLTYRK